MGFGLGDFGIFGVFGALIFATVIGMFIFFAVKGISQWSKNNRSPRLTVPASVVSKRTNVSHTNHPVGGDISGAHGYHTSSDTSYFVTFEVESGDRMELHVDGREFGLLVEGDVGMLTFQGTRYLGFERDRQS